MDFFYMCEFIRNGLWYPSFLGGISVNFVLEGAKAAKFFENKRKL